MKTQSLEKKATTYKLHFYILMTLLTKGSSIAISGIFYIYINIIATARTKYDSMNIKVFKIIHRDVCL